MSVRGRNSELIAIDAAALVAPDRGDVRPSFALVVPSQGVGGRVGSVPGSSGMPDLGRLRHLHRHRIGIRLQTATTSTSSPSSRSPDRSDRPRPAGSVRIPRACSRASRRRPVRGRRRRTRPAGRARPPTRPPRSTRRPRDPRPRCRAASSPVVRTDPRGRPHRAPRRPPRPTRRPRRCRTGGSPDRGPRPRRTRRTTSGAAADEATAGIVLEEHGPLAADGPPGDLPEVRPPVGDEHDLRHDREVPLARVDPRAESQRPGQLGRLVLGRRRRREKAERRRGREPESRRSATGHPGSL